jgi:hypothetical protein
MATQPKWQLSGDYFENCNCSVVCPCLVSTAAPLTSKPTQGVCDVALIFHIDNGNYGSVRLDGLNVAMVAHTPGPMANGNWTVAAYIDERADDKQTETLGAIFTGAAGGPMAAFVPLISNNLGAKKAPIKYQIDGKKRSAEIPNILKMAVEPLPTMHEGGEMWASIGHPVNPEKARACRRDPRQYIQRPRHALGQFRQERPLRANSLVELVVGHAALATVAAVRSHLRRCAYGRRPG